MNIKINKKDHSEKTSDQINLPILASGSNKTDVNKEKAAVSYKEKKGFLISQLRPNLIYDINSSVLNEQYAKETSHFDRYEKPVITPDGIVLKHWEDVLAAEANGLAEMDVIIVEGLDEDELMRYINFCVYFKKLTYLQRFILISELEIYLKTTIQGKAWAKSLQAGNTGIDINSQLGLITGYHKESIKIYKRIGKHGKQFFDETKTLEEMYFEATIAQPKKAPGKSPATIPTIKFGLLKLDIGGNSFEFKDSEAVYKNNMVSYKTTIGKAIIMVIIKNPEQLS